MNIDNMVRLTSDLATQPDAELALTIGSILGTMVAIASAGVFNVGFNNSFTALIDAIFHVDFTLVGSFFYGINQSLQNSLSAALGNWTNGQFIHCFRSDISSVHFLVAKTFGNIPLNVAFDQIMSMSRQFLPYWNHTNSYILIHLHNSYISFCEIHHNPANISVIQVLNILSRQVDINNLAGLGVQIIGAGIASVYYFPIGNDANFGSISEIFGRINRHTLTR